MNNVNQNQNLNRTRNSDISRKKLIKLDDNVTISTFVMTRGQFHFFFCVFSVFFKRLSFVVYFSEHYIRRL